MIIDYTDDRYFYPYLSKVSGVPMKSIARMIGSRLEARLDTAQISLKSFNRAVADRLGIEPSEVRWYETHRDNSKIDRGTMGIARRLRKNYSIAYLSNVDMSRYEWSTKLLRPYLGLFDRRFASCEIKLRKPSAAVYKYVLKHMGLKGSEVVFIDNLRENVQGARRVGIKSILFIGSKDLEKRLRKMGLRL